ncbi:MAG: TIR domain-containing protein [Bacteroidales bacterium]
MEKQTQCPECHSTNIKYFDARKIYNCLDCGFSFSEKEFNKLRIFLSYGHDHNEELVRLIKTDLEKRGHDVWFDKNEIKFGDEWRCSITDGILGSNRVLSFLSKYSTRDPGVCRDEIAIAIGVKGGNIQTILVESEKEVQPPVNIGHIQWLDMHDWQEKRSSNIAEWEQWYQAKLDEIVQVIESDESRRFAGEIDKLNDYLKPIKSDARISGLLSKGFYGREWLFDAVENWRKDSTQDSRLFWIMGDPGVGKSAFAAQLTNTHGDTVISAQFCDWSMPDHRDARRVICSIAFQMATRLPDYRKLLLTLPEIKDLDRKEASELFDYLLANPLKSVINEGREKLLIVIDALDEAGVSGRNPLVEMLARNAHHLPDWLGMVVTSRPEFDVKTPFQALNPFPLDTKSESNKADIRDYLNNKLAIQLQNKSNAEALVYQILEKSEGVFLYAERFCEDVHQGHISLDQPEQFPQGLGGIFAQYFQRQFPHLENFRKEIRPALRAILAAREPLPLEILQKLFNWKDEELRDFTHKLGSLFPVTKNTDSETIKPYHKSLPDWMGDEAKAGVYFVSITEGHKILSSFGFKEYELGPDHMQTYFLSHLPAHLLFINEKFLSRRVRQDKQFILSREIRFYGKRRGMSVYISSTYKDMQSERDYLIRRTFPELNRLLDIHRIDSFPVDLHWGINEDIIQESSGDEVLNLVFHEIDRCRPFFLCLLGERYGWVPENKNISTFEDEIRYAINSSKSKQSEKFFYFRNCQYEKIPSNTSGDYVDSFPRQNLNMTRLKDWLSEMKVSKRTYETNWDLQRDQLWGLQNFGNQVLKDLYDSAIEYFGPCPQYSTKIEQRLQLDYTHRLLKTFIGRKTEITKYYSFITSEPSIKLSFIGEEGVGKSAILAALIELIKEMSNYTFAIHHAGVSEQSLSKRGILENWCAQFEDWLSKPITSFMTIDEIEKEFISCVNLACEEGNTIIVLDNADWFEMVSGKGSLKSLLQIIPKKATVLISNREIIELSSFSYVEILPLTKDEIKVGIQDVLSIYSKQLSIEQINLLLIKPGITHPGILVLLLRILVTTITNHFELTTIIQNISDTFTGLCKLFFDSLERDYDLISVKSVMRKIININDESLVLYKNLERDEAEIIRQIYAVFPEQCTPPEEGMIIRKGGLKNAIINRYI